MLLFHSIFFQSVLSHTISSGTLIKFESPRGVSAKYFEFDWSRVDRHNDNYDYDEEDDIDDDEWLTKEDDLIEQETMKNDDEEKDDDEDDDEDAMENAMRCDAKQWAMEDAIENACSEWDEVIDEATKSDDYDEKAMNRAFEYAIDKLTEYATDKLIHETTKDNDYDENTIQEAMSGSARELVTTLVTKYVMNKAIHQVMRGNDEAERDDDLWWPKSSCHDDCNFLNL